MEKPGDYSIKNDGPSGNRTRVLGSEAQEDILYPMDPFFIGYQKLLSVFTGNKYLNDFVRNRNPPASWC